MVYENGQVIATEPGQVTVAVVQSSACQSCKARHGCGQAVLSQVTDGSRQEAKNHFAIPYAGEVRPGDWVRLAIEEDRLTLAALWLYLVPLLSGFLALLSGHLMSLAEPLQLAMALLGGAVALALTRYRFKSAAQHWVPQIVDVSNTPDPASVGVPLDQNNSRQDIL